MLNREGRKKSIRRFWVMTLTSDTHGVSHSGDWRYERFDERRRWRCSIDFDWPKIASIQRAIVGLNIVEMFLPYWIFPTSGRIFPSGLTLEVCSIFDLRLNVPGLLHISFPLFDREVGEAYFFNRSGALIPWPCQTPNYHTFVDLRSSITWTRILLRRMSLFGD